MSAGLSRVDIMNIGIDLIHDTPLTSPTDSTKAGRAMRRNWNVTRDAELRDHPWNFATVRGLLATAVTAPVHGWKYAYPLPPDCLRVYDLQYDAKFEGDMLNYAIENNGNDQVCIMTDAAAPLYVKYIRRPKVEGIFDPLFCEALGARLAMKCCLTMTGKASHFDRCKLAYDEAIRRAVHADAMEGTPERPQSNSWERERDEWIG